MWGRKRKEASSAPPPPLKDALRKARIDQAERSGVVIDLHDAEVARLELLNEALDPLFEEIPKDIELFDRGGRYYTLYTKQHEVEANLFLAPGEGDTVEPDSGTTNGGR